MRESFAEYRRRILGYLGDRDPIRVQRATPGKLARRIRGVPRGRLSRRPAPDRWSVNEILAHLADAEIAMSWRLRNILATPGVRLAWFDQDLWARKCRYARRNPHRSVELFRALRESNLALLRAVPRRAWRARFGIHPLRGRQTLAEFVRLEAAHDLNHLRQIDRILAARKRGARAARPTGERVGGRAAATARLQAISARGARSEVEKRVSRRPTARAGSGARPGSPPPPPPGNRPSGSRRSTSWETR